MSIFEKEKIIFIHIPKTAGTSIEYYLNKNTHKVYLYKLKKFQHNTFLEYKILLKEKINDYNIFSVVRNPYDRLFSYFKYHLKTARHPALREVLSQKDDIARLYGSYLNYVLKCNLHLVSKTQTSFLENENKKIDLRIKIIKYENLQQEIPNLPKLNVFTTNILKKDIYTKENIEIIKNYFFEDFINFNYHIEYDSLH